MKIFCFCQECLSKPNDFSFHIAGNHTHQEGGNSWHLSFEAHALSLPQKKRCRGARGARGVRARETGQENAEPQITADLHFLLAVLGQALWTGSSKYRLNSICGLSLASAPTTTIELKVGPALNHVWAFWFERRSDCPLASIILQYIDCFGHFSGWSATDSRLFGRSRQAWAHESAGFQGRGCLGKTPTKRITW